MFVFEVLFQKQNSPLKVTPREFQVQNDKTNLKSFKYSSISLQIEIFVYKDSY